MKAAVIKLNNNNYYLKNDRGILGQEKKVPYGYDYIFSYNNSIITSKVGNVTYISNNLEFKPLSQKLLNKIFSDNKTYIIVLENGYPEPIINKSDIFFVFGLAYPLRSKITNNICVAGKIDTELTLGLLGLPIDNKYAYYANAYDFYTPYSDLNIYSINDNNKETSGGFVTITNIFNNPHGIKFKAEIEDIGYYIKVPKSVDKIYYYNGNIIIRNKLDNFDPKELNKFIDSLDHIFSGIVNDFIVEYK